MLMERLTVMDMGYVELIKEIKSGNLRNLYLFYGSEEILIREIVNFIRKTLVKKEVDEMNYSLVEGKDEELEDIIALAETMPFFSQKRVVVIRDFLSLIVDRDSEKTFTDFIENLPSHICMILISSTVDKRKKIYKSIEKKGIVTEFQPLKGNALIRWIEERFSHEGKKIDKRTALFLANTFNRNLEELDSEIKKAITYVGDEKEFIKQDDILPILRKTLENNVFLLIDALGQKDFRRAISILNDMLKEGESSIWILFMIMRQIRLIYRCLILLQNGLSFKDIQETLKEHPFVLKKAITQGNNFSLKQLDHALNFALETDVEIKKGVIEPKLAIEILLLKVSAVLS
jgi:DNA polymerase-3 subunit delta